MSQNKVLLQFPNVEVPRKAMILAAGLGTRMRPLTETMPKPLVRVCGRALIDHALDAVRRARIKEVVVNVHHHADQLVDHLEKIGDLDITISDECDTLLDSGGGILKALPLLGNQPFFVLNADSFWIEGFQPNLQRMAEQWKSDRMAVLLLLASMASAVGFASKGDFIMDPDGRLKRRPEGHVAPFAYAGAAIIDPKMFDGVREAKFSLNQQFDDALEMERLFGLRLEGLWLHVGTPDAIQEAEEAIARSAA